MSIKAHRTQDNMRGQALVEFALILPIVLFLIFGIIDFGRLFIAFTSASGNLREASRYAATVGEAGTTRRYLDCTGMQTTAQNVFFVDSQTITVRHYDAATQTQIGTDNCSGVTDDALENGDYLQIDSSNTVNLITPFLSGLFPPITLNFTAQRTIVKGIDLVASSTDSEPDGLDDTWEILWYDPIDTYGATDDPDGDGCNNGCEILFRADPLIPGSVDLDPTNPDSDGDGLSDGDEIFIYGSDPRVFDTDGDGIDDGTEVANGTDPTTDDPFAVDDLYTVDAYITTRLDVLSNDHTQIPAEKQIIAFDTPTTFGATVVLNDNGTPGVTADDTLDYTPFIGFTSGTDTFTYTITDSSGLTSTTTVTLNVVESSLVPTPAPTAIPADIIHGVPFWEPVLNGSPQSQDWWRLDRHPVFMGYDEWVVEWWTHDGTLADAGNVMGTVAACTSGVSYDTPLTYNWGASAPSSCGMPADNFSARWTRSFGTASTFTATFTVMADDAIQILVDGTAILDNWSFGGLYENTVSHTFSGGAEHTIVIRYAESTGNAMMVFAPHDGTVDDRGVCGWDYDGADGYNGAPSWTDFPGRNYYNSSRCHLELRGAVDLTGLANPEMTFWEHWALADANDTAWLEIREYGGGTAWYGTQLHIGPETQPAWTRQVIDLDRYSAINMSTGTSAGQLDFTDTTIEFRYTIVGGDDATTDSGWWVDEIRIEEGTPDIFSIPWSDDMDSGNLYWQPGGTWAISAEKTRSGAGAWSDSPSSSYFPSADYILELDGLVDVTTATDPLLVFYHSWDLGAGDSLNVEYSTDGGTIWAPIGGTPLETASTNSALVREEVSLDAIKGTTFQLRFRLAADAADEAGGWWIDDIELAERDLGVITGPFTDDVNNALSEYWYPDGTWAMSSEANHGGGLGSAWSDSPAANYLHQSDSSLRSQQRFDLSAMVDPELSFWYRRALGVNDGLYAEVSSDFGATWTTIWSREYCGSGATSETAPDSTGTPVDCSLFNEQLGWERVSVNLGAYTGTPFYLRFRLDALDDAGIGDGTWIDDISIASYPYTASSHSLPFTDDMDDTTNWHLGGTWDTTFAEQYAGAASITDSPIGPYTTSTWSILELQQPISLAGVVAADQPMLSWWDRYALAQYDYARVQVSTFTGPEWSAWGPWEELDQHYFETNTSWNQHMVDLSAYAGQRIRIRFVLDALNLVNVDDGWYIDEIEVALHNPTIYTVPFTESADSLARWIPGGNWNTSAIALGSGTSGLSAGAWSAYFYDLTGGVCTGLADDAARAEAALTGTSACGTPYGSNPVALGDVQFTCAPGETPDPVSGACSATPWIADHLGILFTRTFTVTEPGQYSFTVAHDDGARVYVYPVGDPRPATPALDRWFDTVPPTPSGIVDTDLVAGDYTVEVWYYKSVGESVITLDIDRPSLSFYGETTGAFDDMFLTLDGLIDLDGVANPALSWFERYDLLNTESCIVVEVALPNYRSDQWATAAGPFCGAASQPAFAAQTVPNLLTVLQTLEDIADHGALTISGDDALMALRFRLYGDVANNEWWIEDIVVSGP